MLRLAAKPVAEKLRSETAQRVEAFHKRAGRSPKLVVVLVGEDPASVIYTSKKGDAAVKVGMEHETLRFPTSASPDEVLAELRRLNEDPTVDGILVQRPLPPQFSEREVLHWIAPSKDVDGFHPQNVGGLMLGIPTLRPCTPSGVMEMLKHYEINPAGKTAVVIGRSSIVGKPMAALLLQADATVIQCHSRTRDLQAMTRQGEIVVAAAGKPELIDSTFIRPGAVVIDVGIHRKEDGKLCGDVHYDSVSTVASAVSPVPGGVGPMTITMLLKNTVEAAERRVS